jgi:hypothetical protein
MEAGKRNITGIFNRATKLQVPYFQRSYVWDEDQWSRFLDDMRYAARANQHYFMGSIILKQQPTTLGQGDIRTIIDGQQRLTTMMLFFKALYEANGTIDQFNNIFTTFLGDLIIEHNYIDRPVFEKIMLNQVDSLAREDRGNKIFKCYEYFHQELQSTTIDPNPLFNNIVFIGIDLQSDEDEQQIFDTINSLGVRLTTAELLKNHLFNRDYQAYQDHWQQIFELDVETRDYWDIDVTSGRLKRSNIDLFLQSYLFIKIQDPIYKVSSDDKERFYKIDSTFNSYKEFIEGYDIDKDQLIRELKEYAEVYRGIIDPNCTQRPIGKDDLLGRLNLVIFGNETATIIPYMLYLSKKQPEEKIRNDIYRYLEAYLMRRIICKITAKNYNQVIRSLIGNEVDTLSKLKEFIEKKEEKINRMPADSDVQRGFHISQLTNKQAKCVMYLLETAVRSDRHATNLRDFDDYSLEHVMPKKWRNKWGAVGMTEEEQYSRDRSLLTLGNLTLITSRLNSAIRDADWKTKKSGTNSNPGLDKYAQGLETFSDYLSRDVWDETVISERADQISKYALSQVWTLNFE